MTTEVPDTARRPSGVTFVVVLAYIMSIFTLLNGVFTTIDADTLGFQAVAGMTEDELMWAGVVTIAVGAIGILLTAALARGSQVVRILFTVWIAFQIATGLYALVSYAGEERGAGAVTVGFGVVLLILLFSSKADDFFEGRY